LLSITPFDHFLAKLFRRLCGLIFYRNFICHIVYGKASKEVEKPLGGCISAPSGNLLSYLTSEHWSYELFKIVIMGTIEIFSTYTTMC